MSKQKPIPPQHTAAPTPIDQSAKLDGPISGGGGRFRVLIGQVIATDPATNQDRTYNVNETFESSDNMEALLNGGGGMARKVERVV